MQFGKATLVEVNDERNVHKNLWQLVLFRFGMSRETPEMVRLRSSAAASEKKCSELEEKYRAAEFRDQAQGKKLATAYAAIAVLVVTVILCMILPQMRLLIGLVGLGVVFGNQLLPMAASLKQYVSQGLRLSTTLWQSASQQICPLFGDLVQFVGRIRRRIRDWRWKFVPASRSLNTAP